MIIMTLHLSANVGYIVILIFDQLPVSLYQILRRVTSFMLILFKYSND